MFPTPSPTVPADPIAPAAPFLGGLLAAGGASILLVIALYALAFFISALLFGLWLRLVVRLHRGFFDREYARLMGRYHPTKADRRPRGGYNW